MAEDKKEMGFLDHLEELRRRLFWSVIAVVAGIVVIVWFDDFVINDLIMGPKNLDFVTYKSFCDFSHFMGLGDQLCYQEMNFKLQSTTMGGNFSAYMLVCIVGGVVIAFPFIIYQLWGFVKPGLHLKERSVVNGVVFYISLLFFLGVLFGYYILTPLSIAFLGNFQFGDVEVNSTVLSYLKLVVSLVLGTGLIFQLPVVVYFLGKMGVISSTFLKKYRKHAFVVNLIIAAIITPPDVTSQLLVSLPILLLYEISIFVVARVEKKADSQPI
jgi:sec-independent protein translocase protein TatC